MTKSVARWSVILVLVVSPVGLAQQVRMTQAKAQQRNPPAATPAKAAPSPVTQKKPPIPAGWGTVVDPAGDCTVVEDKGVLRIVVPGIWRDLNPTAERNKNLLAPRVLQPVTGDFLAEVKVGEFERPKANTSSNGICSYVGAGLLVWKDDKNFLRWGRAANGETDTLFAAGEVFEGGEMVNWLTAELPDRPVYLRGATGREVPSLDQPRRTGVGRDQDRRGPFWAGGSGRSLRCQFDNKVCYGQFRQTLRSCRWHAESLGDHLGVERRFGSGVARGRRQVAVRLSRLGEARRSPTEAGHRLRPDRI